MILVISQNRHFSSSSSSLACKTASAYAIHRVQRVGAQAVIGSFTSVATGVAEAEAHIATIHERFWRRASKLWVFGASYLL
ncbi:hypothetical protein HZ326_25593 [Fusarium oxysporum f. sp. albedinis]|nr:hypothetical protein HZ326_25593 [Fusarium oxysporum f. sp. albedinis]